MKRRKEDAQTKKKTQIWSFSTVNQGFVPYSNDIQKTLNDWNYVDDPIITFFINGIEYEVQHLGSSTFRQYQKRDKSKTRKVTFKETSSHSVQEELKLIDELQLQAPCQPNLSLTIDNARTIREDIQDNPRNVHQELSRIIGFPIDLIYLIGFYLDTWNDLKNYSEISKKFSMIQRFYPILKSIIVFKMERRIARLPIIRDFGLSATKEDILKTDPNAIILDGITNKTTTFRIWFYNDKYPILYFEGTFNINIFALYGCMTKAINKMVRLNKNPDFIFVYNAEDKMIKLFNQWSYSMKKSEKEIMEEKFKQWSKMIEKQ